MALGEGIRGSFPDPIGISGVGGGAPATAEAAGGGLMSMLGSAPVIGGLVSGGLGLIGGILGNRSAKKEAAAQREWQERMRATQYQTAVEDLQKAGLNPMLAYTQGGAGTPSGAQAQQRDVVSPSIASAVAGASALSNMANVAADTENKRATTANIDASTQKLLQEAQVQKWLARETMHRGTSAAAHAEVDWASQSEALKLIQANLAARQAEARIRGYEVAGARAESKFYEGPLGDLSKYVGPLKEVMSMLPGMKLLSGVGGRK